MLFSAKVTKMNWCTNFAFFFFHERVGYDTHTSECPCSPSYTCGQEV